MYFDGGIFLGREPKYGLVNDEEKIQSRLTAQGIDRALAVHFEAVYYDMITGNEQTLELAKKSNGQLVPLAVINPFHYDSTSNYLAELKVAGFAGIALLSHYQYWKFDQCAAKKLAADLCTLGLPVQIGVANATELNQTVELFKNCQSPVLIRWLRGGGYNYVSDEIAINQDYKNFYFDVSNLVGVEQIKLLVEKIGADHLYVASNSPLTYEDSIFLLFESAGLTEPDQKLIARQTLENIFKTPITEPLPITFTKLHQDIINRPKIDVHWHTHGWDIIEPGKELPVMTKVFDALNYEKVMASSVMALNYDLVKGNAETAEMMAIDARMYGYIVIDPIRPEESMRELEKYQNNSKFIGIKTIQDYYNVGIDDPRYEPMLAWAATHDYPLLCHRAGVITVAKKYPNLKIIAGHISLERLEQLIELKNLPNVWLDVSGSYTHRGETNLQKVVENVGTDRVLYSSDGPLISPYWAIGKWVNVSGLTEVDLEKIYRTNALKIFSRL